MAVARVTKIIGSSPKSWQDAADEALKRAHKTLRGVTGIHLLQQKAYVEKGKAQLRRSARALDRMFRGRQRVGNGYRLAGRV